MILFVFLLLISIVFAEKYAVIYGTVESFTYTELPSSPCRVYSYLFSLGYEAQNIVYMLDTTDYDMDWTLSYKNWYSGENYYLRDQFFTFSCGGIDFAGSYVDPMFLMHYMQNDFEYIAEKSGLDEFKKLNFNKSDRITVFLMDTHGRGSQFYPSRILSSSDVSKAFNYMKEKKMFSSMLWFVEATYADRAFASAEKQNNIIVVTIKDAAVGGKFMHIYDNGKKTAKYIQGVWENSWITLLPYTCNKPVRYLIQVAMAASVQQSVLLTTPGIWGDRKLLDTPLNVFLGVEKCPSVFKLHDKEIPQDDVKGVISGVMGSNFNQTLLFQYNREYFQKYSRHVDSIVKKVFMSELTETAGIVATTPECILHLQDSFVLSCNAYMPIADVYLSYFLKLCQNRKDNGYFMIDFGQFCKSS